MEIKSLAATFGRLKNETLSLAPGLNVIEAVNESGKSTWMAFLRVMLYGINTRDRNPLADKHRYLPWDGSTMQGRMDLTSDDRSITITRSTTRTNSPLGTFSAHYSDTSEPIPELTAATLGESLLGVPQDVFERSAFIRQSGISIDQSAALEKRIAALVTTGEEDTSYIDAAERLRKQLTRRRYNKTGILPQLENETAALETTLSEITTLEASRRKHEADRDALVSEIAYLEHQLTLCTAAEASQQIARLNAARDALARCENAAMLAAHRTAALPSPAALTAMIGDLSALEATAASVRIANERLTACTLVLEQAQQQRDSHPFSPHPPEQAAKFPPLETQRPPLPVLPLCLIAICGVILFLALRSVLHLSLAPAAFSTALIASALAAFCTVFSVRRRRLWDSEYTRKRVAHEEALAAYTILYEAVERAQTDCRTAAETHRALSADHTLRLDHTLNRIRQFHPAANIIDARRAIETALSLHAAAEAAQREQQQAQLRFDLLAENTPADCTAPTEPPTLSREEAERRLLEANERLTQLRRNLHTLEGRCEALGDPLLLRAEIEEKRRRRDTIQQEYDAISLASSVLSEANTALQSRFSPALGEKAANIFTKLTKGKYNKVLLDRKMIPSAQESGDILAHPALSLSQGAADQLYLAVRLAVCDLILPKTVPIFLDDALVTFDDLRMAAALDYLLELSETRQIVLFTCQQRELRYLQSAHPQRYHAIQLTSHAQQ